MTVLARRSGDAEAAVAAPRDPQGSAGRLEASYVLPLRWSADDALAELTAYLRQLSAQLDVIVADASPEPLFSRHAAAWDGWVRHLRVIPGETGNGKVTGVCAGLHAARHEAVVIADDDVRWDRAGLEHGLDLLVDADLVRPQNVFHPLPWHARWDTARSLLNRALGGDYPGTYLIRRSTFVAMGSYAADVLFENLELARTVRAHGGRESVARSLLVRRRPPSTTHFLGQRVRQAYDDFAQPGRLVLEASLLPAALLLAAGLIRRRAGSGRTPGPQSPGSPLSGPVAALVPVAASIALAEAGRRRDGGRAAFPADAALWAPLWLAERAVCVWLAIGHRLRGGMPYAGSRLRTAAHSPAQLRARARARVGSRMNGGVPVAAPARVR